MSGLADTFMQIMTGQPLSLALVVVDLLLLVFLFKTANTHDKARRETMALVVQWQKESQVLMANAVSKEVMEMILGALERDRETYRAMLPSYGLKSPNEPPPRSD